jgi:hypothetical protein
MMAGKYFAHGVERTGTDITKHYTECRQGQTRESVARSRMALHIRFRLKSKRGDNHTLRLAKVLSAILDEMQTLIG